MSKRKISIIGFIILLFGIFLFVVNSYNIANINKFSKKNNSKIERIITLLPSVQEIVSMLGAGKKIVGTSEHSVYPPEIRNVPFVNGFSDVNYEKIMMLKPDIVIGSDALKNIDTEFDKLNINYYCADCVNISEIFNSIKVIGEKIGYSKQAAELIQNIKNDVEKYKKGINKEKITGKALIAVGSNDDLQNVYVAGKNNLFSEMIELLGLENAYKGELVYASVSPENILNMNADYVFILSEKNNLSIKEKNNIIKPWKKVKFSASENNKIFVLNGDYIYIPGPRFPLILRDIANNLIEK